MKNLHLTIMLLALLLTSCGKEISIHPSATESVTGAMGQYFQVVDQEYVYHSSGDNGNMEIDLNCRNMIPGELTFSFGIAVYDAEGNKVADADDVLPESTLKGVSNMSQGETTRIKLENLPSLSEYSDADSLTFRLTSRLTSHHALEDGNYTLIGEVDEGVSRQMTLSLTVDGLKVIGAYGIGKSSTMGGHELTGDYVPAGETLTLIDSIGDHEVGMFTGVIENDTIFTGKFIDKESQMAAPFRFVITKGGDTIEKKNKEVKENGEAVNPGRSSRKSKSKGREEGDAPKSEGSAPAAEAPKPAASSGGGTTSGGEGMSKAEKAAAKRAAQSSKPASPASE